MKTTTILDRGAGVAIATKAIWEKWGKPALRQTRLKLQLADGHIEQPMGVLEQVIMTSCGIEYEYTFAVVDFGTKNNYDVILGRPFMRQLKMVQDWGYDYIYLRHLGNTTRINMKDHSYKDVNRTPVEDFDSTTTTKTKIPFMRQLKMVQDWGYDYIYLRHLGNTTRINMKDHIYRDVNRTPVDEDLILL